MQNKESKFNWKLPLYGAVGFGFGYVIGIAIVSIIGGPIGGKLGLLIGGIMGTTGGASLGLALKDKKKVIYLASGGAIGFAIGCSLMFAIVINLTSPVGDAIMGALGGAMLGLVLKDIKKIFYLSCAGAIGFPIGFLFGVFVMATIVENVHLLFAIWAAIGGFALGLTLAYLTREDENKNEKPTHIQLN